MGSVIPPQGIERAGDEWLRVARLSTERKDQGGPAAMRGRRPCLRHKLAGQFRLRKVATADNRDRDLPGQGGPAKRPRAAFAAYSPLNPCRVGGVPGTMGTAFAQAGSAARGCPALLPARITSTGATHAWRSRGGSGCPTQLRWRLENVDGGSRGSGVVPGIPDQEDSETLICYR